MGEWTVEVGLGGVQPSTGSMYFTPLGLVVVVVGSVFKGARALALS